MIYLVDTLLVSSMLWGAMILRKAVNNSIVQKKVFLSNKKIQTYPRFYDIWDEHDEDDECEE